MLSYESVYGMGAVDYEAIERGLLAEMFQGGSEDGNALAWRERIVVEFTSKSVA